MENENELLKKMKTLSTERLAAKHRMETENSRSWEQHTTLGNLRRDMGKAEAEVHLAQERETLLAVEITELERQVQELKGKKAHVERVTMEMVEPRINALNREISDFTESLAADRAIGGNLAKEKEAAGKRIASLLADREKAEQLKVETRQQLVKGKAEPEKVRKQGDVVSGAKQAYDNENGKAAREAAGLESDLKTQLARKKELEDERLQLHLQLENLREHKETRERISQDIMRELALAQEEANVHVAQGVELDRDVRAVLGEIKRAHEQALKVTREKDGVAKQVRKREFQLASLVDSLPGLEAQVAALTLEREELKAEHRRRAQQIADLRAEVDVYIHSYLVEEGTGKVKGEALAKETAALRAKEAEVARLTQEEHAINQEITNLTMQREVKAREAALAARNAKATLEELKMRDKQIQDLTKQYGEITARHAELQKLYEGVKTDRNRHVNLIQACTQQIAELKEKIKILQNEVEILRNESMDLDKALGRNRTEMGNAVNVRDALRTETNKHLYECREKQKAIDQQIAQIDKLNAIINSAEEEMLRIKRQYESAVEDRNFAGIQLIDRNDEICILYEKLNIQEEILRKGELEFRKLEEEKRLFAIEERDVERTIAALRKRLPQVPELERQVAQLQRELAGERAQAAKLSEDLESPLNEQRWRALAGKDPTPEELAVKIQSLEVALNEKKEQLLEKDLILEEVTLLSDQLRAQAQSGRDDTLDLSKKANEIMGKIKDKTRRMMCTVSELSIYQATAIKLAQDKEALEEELREGTERFERGEAPSEEVEREWFKLERERLARKEQILIAAEARTAARDDIPANAVKTTAEPRPNAYIPTGAGIALPRPYGGQTPFKPTELGANMRHIRKPVKKEIEL